MEDPRISWTVARLRTLPAPSTIADAARVGQIVLDAYGGDPDLLRHRGRKAVSLRRLAEAPGLRLTPVSLWRAVAIHDLTRRLPWLVGASHLGVSHVRAVLPLDDACQATLLTRGERERWSKRRLEREAAAHRHRRRASELPSAPSVDPCAPRVPAAGCGTSGPAEQLLDA